MFLLLYLVFCILYSDLDGEKIVFANDSEFNTYAVQIQYNNNVLFKDTLSPQTKTEYSVFTNVQYKVSWNRLTKFGEYLRFPSNFEVQNNISTISLKSNNMVTIHLAPRDIP